MQDSSHLAHGCRVYNVCVGVHGHLRDRAPWLHWSMSDSKLKSRALFPFEVSTTATTTFLLC